MQNSFLVFKKRKRNTLYSLGKDDTQRGRILCVAFADMDQMQPFNILSKLKELILLHSNLSTSLLPTFKNTVSRKKCRIKVLMHLVGRKKMQKIILLQTSMDEMDNNTHLLIERCQGKKRNYLNQKHNLHKLLPNIKNNKNYSFNEYSIF